MFMDYDSLEETANLRDYNEKELVLKTAYINAIGDEKLSLVFNLPTLVPKLFAMVTEGDPEKLTRILAHIEEVDFKKKSISNSHIIRFDDEYLLANNKIGVLILNADVSPVLAALPNPIVFEEDTITPYLVVLINSHEYRIWKNEGNDALMEYFSEIDKNLVAIG